MKTNSILIVIIEKTYYTHARANQITYYRARAFTLRRLPGFTPVLSHIGGLGNSAPLNVDDLAVA